MPIIKVFRRFHSNNTSARQAVTEISNLVPGSNVELSERSSVSPNTSKRPIRKKVASADRRLMLESFVNKYRSMNVGKFPSPTSAQKEVGGSYYIIRKMLQEMEYNFRISSEEKGLVKENKKLTKGEDTINREIVIESSGSQYESNSQVTINQQLSEDPLSESKGEDTISREIVIESSGSQQESNSQVIINQQLSEDPLPESKGEDTISREIAIESSGSQEESNSQVTINQQLYEDPLLESVSNFELKEGFQPSTSSADAGNSNVTRHDTHNIATKSDDIKGQCHQMPEQKPKDESYSEDKLVFEDSQSKVEKQRDGIRHNMRDMPEQQKDEDLRGKPSLWGNLKSMATEFFNSWKK